MACNVEDLYGETYRAMYRALVKHGCCPCGTRPVDETAEEALAELGLSMDAVRADARLASIFRAVADDIWGGND